jgi:hypothetical protein
MQRLLSSLDTSPHSRDTESVVGPGAALALAHSASLEAGVADAGDMLVLDCVEGKRERGQEGVGAAPSPPASSYTYS